MLVTTEVSHVTRLTDRMLVTTEVSQVTRLTDRMLVTTEVFATSPPQELPFLKGRRRSATGVLPMLASQLDRVVGELRGAEAQLGPEAWDDIPDPTALRIGRLERLRRSTLYCQRALLETGGCGAPCVDG
eukprot:gene45993-21422_t